MKSSRRDAAKEGPTMLDIQYTLEKLAEYRELGHDDYAVRIDDRLIGARRLRSLRLTLLAIIGTLFGR